MFEFMFPMKPQRGGPLILGRGVQGESDSEWVGKDSLVMRKNQIWSGQRVSMTCSDNASK